MTGQQEPDHEGFEQRMRDVDAELEALVSDAQAAVTRRDASARDMLASRALAVVAKITAVASEAVEVEQWHLDQAAVTRDARKRYDAAADQLLKQAAIPSKPHGGERGR